MSTCFDASALVKLLLDEGDSGIAGPLWSDADDAFASTVGYAELRGSISRALRGGRIVPDEYPTLRMELASGSGGPSSRSASSLAVAARGSRWPTGTASARSTRSTSRLRSSIATPTDRPTLVTFDRRLAEAALAEGLTVLPEVA